MATPGHTQTGPCCLSDGMRGCFATQTVPPYVSVYRPTCMHYQAIQEDLQAYVAQVFEYAQMVLIATECYESQTSSRVTAHDPSFGTTGDARNIRYRKLAVITD